jgi:hypothetical protein
LSIKPATQEVEVSLGKVNVRLYLKSKGLRTWLKWYSIQAQAQKKKKKKKKDANPTQTGYKLDSIPTKIPSSISIFLLCFWVF